MSSLGQILTSFGIEKSRHSVFKLKTFKLYCASTLNDNNNSTFFCGNKARVIKGGLGELREPRLSQDQVNSGVRALSGPSVIMPADPEVINIARKMYPQRLRAKMGLHRNWSFPQTQWDFLRRTAKSLYQVRRTKFYIVV